MSGRSLARFAVLIGLVTVIAGCAGLPFGLGASDGPNVEHPYPAGCQAFDLSPRRCAAIVDALGEQAGLTPAQIASVSLLGDEGCQSGTGPMVMCARTTSFIVRARFRSVDGRTIDKSQFCGVGGQYTILCSDDPEIALSTPADGYFDVPCVGDTPDTCATRFPEPDATTAAAEQPLEIGSLVVPIDHLGAYDIKLGTGSLANGILERSTMSVADLHPTDLLLDAGGLQLRITSLAPDGKPFDNYYLHGRRDGVEPFSAELHFDVLWFEPGAALDIEGIDVS